MRNQRIFHKLEDFINCIGEIRPNDSNILQGTNNNTIMSEIGSPTPVKSVNVVVIGIAMSLA